MAEAKEAIGDNSALDRADSFLNDILIGKQNPHRAPEPHEARMKEEVEEKYILPEEELEEVKNFEKTETGQKIRNRKKKKAQTLEFEEVERSSKNSAPAGKGEGDDFDDFESKEDFEGEYDEGYEGPQRSSININKKWFIEIYDLFQSMIGMVAYDKILRPEELIEEKKKLMAAVIKGQLDAKGQKRLAVVDAELSKYKIRREEFKDEARMDEELKEQAKECMGDLMEYSEIDIHPGWAIFILLAAPVVMNVFRIIMEKWSNPDDY